MNNEPVAWIDPRELDMTVSTSVTKHKQFDTDIPLYTHPAKNNGGNPEELNTRQIQDARTSLESTPPFAYAVVSKECPDGMENMSLQFNEPVEAKKVIPLYERPIDVTDEEILEIIEQVSEEQRLVWLGDKVIFPFARAILRKAQEK